MICIGIAGVAMTASAAPTRADYAAFLDRVSEFDRLSSPEVSRYSRCASFAHLFASLYEMDGRDGALALGDAAIFLGDTSEIYSKMGAGSRILLLSRGSGVSRFARISPWKPLANRIVRTLSSRMEAALGTAPMDVFAFSEWSNSRSSHAGLPAVNQAKARAIQFFAGTAEPVKTPGWLSEHWGGGKGIPEASIGNQDLAHGYVQFAGDLDGTGRHDHFIANAVLGYSAESSGISRILYRPTAHAATWLDEYRSSDQNGSPTDAEVNARGVRFGIELARLERKGSAKDPVQFEREVFGAVCDENIVKVSARGPIAGTQLQ